MAAVKSRKNNRSKNTRGRNNRSSAWMWLFSGILIGLGLAYFLFSEGYIPQLHAAPGHVLPVLETVAEDPAYRDNEIINKYPQEIDLMASAAAAGYNLGFETTAHQPNPKAGEIIASNALAEMVQRVVLNDENAQVAVGNTARRLEEIMRI
jgi:multiple sugar transport system substrate-binding protein